MQYFAEKWKPRRTQEKCFRRFQKDSGLWIQAERRKMRIFKNKINYLGQMIDKNDRRPDPTRVSAIKDMSALENISSLQSFLGLANYYNVFLPNMHGLRASLNKQLKKDAKWVWTIECQEAFEKIKRLVFDTLRSQKRNNPCK